MPQIRIYFGTMQPLVPDIDEDFVLPANAAEALPSLSPSQELDMRVRTIKLISDLSGQPIIPDKTNEQDATQLARQMIEDPKARPDFAIYPNETIAFLAGMVKQMNHALVDDLAELKNYVITGLVKEIETAKDGKTRLQALTKLGEVDGVDAFKRRSEVTHVIKPIEEVEKELMSVLEGIEYKVVGEQSATTDP
jgi:hypothetical protein